MPMFRTWFNRLMRQPHSPGRRGRARPQVERLEAREVPAAALVSANAANTAALGGRSLFDRPTADGRSVSADGNLVVFHSTAAAGEAVGGTVADANAAEDVFLRNVSTSKTVLVSRSRTAGQTANAAS